MKLSSRYFKIKINVNPLGLGGHEFYTIQPAPKNCIWGQIWTGDYCDIQNQLGYKNLPMVHSILLWYPENNKFEPGKTYVVNAFIRSYEDLNNNFSIGNKFNITIGTHYDGNNWATAEILEILNGEQNNEK
jgi:hypothetical protein